MAESSVAAAGARLGLRLLEAAPKLLGKKVSSGRNKDNLCELTRSVLRSETVTSSQLEAWKSSLFYFDVVLDNIVAHFPPDQFPEQSLLISFLKAKAVINPNLFKSLDERLMKAEDASLKALNGEAPIKHHNDFPLIQAFDVWQFCFAARFALMMENEQPGKYVQLIIKSWQRQVLELYKKPLVQQCLTNNLGQPAFKQKEKAFLFLKSVLNNMAETAQFFAKFVANNSRVLEQVKDFVANIDSVPEEAIEELKECHNFLELDVDTMFRDVEPFDWSSIESDRNVSMLFAPIQRFDMKHLRARATLKVNLSDAVVLVSFIGSQTCVFRRGTPSHHTWKSRDEMSGHRLVPKLTLGRDQLRVLTAVLQCFDEFANVIPLLSASDVFCCEQCTMAFSSADYLQKHIQRTHSGEKPFECTECGKTFINSSSLKTHKLTHSGEKPFECTKCGKTFINSSSLKTHKLTHSGEKPFECTKCGKTFINSSSLKTHKLTHSGKKPFECTKCGKKFRHSSHLKQHKLTHSGEKPFECTECGKTFINSSSLNQHKLTHTRQSDK